MNQGICILLAFLHEVPFDLLAPLFLVWSEPLIDHALKPRHVTNEAHRFGYHLAINFSAPRASVQNDRPDPRKAFNEKVATASKLKQGYLTGKNHQRHLAFSKGCKELRGLAVVEVLVEDRPTVDTQNGQPRLERLQNFCS